MAEGVRKRLETKTNRPITDSTAMRHALVRTVAYVTRRSIRTVEMAAVPVTRVVRALLPMQWRPKVTWAPRGVDEAEDLVVRCSSSQSSLRTLTRVGHPWPDSMLSADRKSWRTKTYLLDLALKYRKCI